MTTTIKRGASKKAIARALKEIASSAAKTTGLDAYKYCGLIKLVESPKKIQIGMRSEWR